MNRFQHDTPYEERPTLSSLLNIATGFYVGVRYEMPLLGVLLIFVLAAIDMQRATTEHPE